MSAGMYTAQRAVLRFGVPPVTLTLLAAALGSVVPAQAAEQKPAANSLLPGSSPSRGTVYVTNLLSDSVSPIATATNTAGPSIGVGAYPYAIAITPDGKTAYVANENSGTVTRSRPPPTPRDSDPGGKWPGCHRDHPGWQDRLRIQQWVQHGDRDRDHHQHPRAIDLSA